MRLKNIFTSFIALFWLLYLPLEFLVWSRVVRYAVFRQIPVVETFSSLLNDLLWLPLAVALPIYLAYYVAKISEWKIIKSLACTVGLFIFILGVFHLDVYFRYLFYLMLPLFALLLIDVIKSRKIRGYAFFYVIALVGLILNYQTQLIPKIEIGRNRPKQSLSVMSYNILVDQSNEKRLEAIELIRRQKPDLVFVQEIRTSDRKLLRRRLADLYPYQHWSEKWENYNGGVIFSRIPFVSTRNANIHTKYAKGYINLNHAVIQWNGRNVHLFNVHLYHSGNVLLKLIFGRITLNRFLTDSESSYFRHIDEAKQIAERISRVDEPVIFAGDFNDTPNSFVYHIFAKKLQNAFRTAGWGLGTTFGYISLLDSVPTILRPFVFNFLRIDHIFCSNHFKIVKSTVLHSNASDHEPQIAVITLK
ncbi:MAG: hypothetical protein GXO75_00685 [Calditrichaeota bacterium]|nr:hypothetical protein [Calditrichota bacterium]